MSNLLFDTTQTVSHVADLRKDINQTAQEDNKETPYLALEDSVIIPSIFGEMIFDQQNISTTKKLIFSTNLTPTVNDNLLTIEITPQWVLDNVIRFDVTATKHTYFNFTLNLDIICNGSPLCWGSLVSMYFPDGHGAYDPFYRGDTTYIEDLNASTYMIQPVHINTKRSWQIPSDTPFRCFRLPTTESLSNPSYNFRIGDWRLRVLNTIRSNTTIYSAPEVQVYASANIVYGGQVHSGDSIIK